MLSLEELFCSVDDFCQQFEPIWQRQLLGSGLQARDRERSLCLSEIMTILIRFNQQHYRTFKHYYREHVCVYWRQAFPRLVSYSRFVRWMPCPQCYCPYAPTSSNAWVSAVALAFLTRRV